MAAGGLTITGGGHRHGGHGPGGFDHRGFDQGDHDPRGLVDVPAKFTPAVMAWLRTYLDGLSDSLHGGHDDPTHRGNTGYGPNDGRNAITGFDGYQGSDRETVPSGNGRGDVPRTIHMWHADATVAAADTSSASLHFTRGAGGGLTFVNNSRDAATVHSGHHAGGEGVNAVTAFGASGRSYFAGGTGTHDYTHDYPGANSSIGGNTLFAGTGMSTGGAGQHSFMPGISATLTGSHAAGLTNLYDFMRGSATEPSGGTHHIVSDFNASDSTMFITDSTKGAGSFGADSHTKHVLGGAETLLGDGSSITLKGVDPHSLVAQSSHNGGISIT